MNYRFRSGRKKHIIICFIVFLGAGDVGLSYLDDLPIEHGDFPGNM